MAWDWTVKVTDLAIVLATFVGPIAAVASQRIIDAKRARRQRQDYLFRTLMTTRAKALSAEHVNALNAVPLDFHGKNEVLLPWRTYLAHLNSPQDNMPLWLQRRSDLMGSLLVAMGTFLKFEVDALQVAQEVYNPRGHADLEAQQTALRTEILEVLDGRRSIPMDVKNFPVDDAASATLRELHARLVRWLDGELVPRVEVAPRNGAERAPGDG